MKFMKLRARFVFPFALCLGILLIALFFGLAGWHLLALMMTLSALLGAALVLLHPRAGLILIGFALIPSVVYLAYAVLERPAWDVGAVIWEVSEKNGRTASCRDILPPVSGSNVTEQSDYTRASISPQRASHIGDAVFFNEGPPYAAFFNALYYRDGPRLVTATFPDGTTRLAWYMVLTSLPHPIEGTSTNLYIDAQSGAALMLIRDVFVPADVQFECGRITIPGVATSYQSVLLLLTTSQLALIGYLAVLMILAGVYLGVLELRPR